MLLGRLIRTAKLLQSNSFNLIFQKWRNIRWGCIYEVLEFYSFSILFCIIVISKICHTNNNSNNNRIDISSRLSFSWNRTRIMKMIGRYDNTYVWLDNCTFIVLSSLFLRFNHCLPLINFLHLKLISYIFLKFPLTLKSGRGSRFFVI